MFICAHCHNAIPSGAVFHFGKAYHDDCFVQVAQPTNQPIPKDETRRLWSTQELRQLIADELGRK